MQNLTEHFEKREVSNELLNLLSQETMINGQYYRMATTLLMVSAMARIGEVEHTSDWDLGAEITFMDDIKVSVVQGWADCLSLITPSNKVVKEEAYSYNHPNLRLSFTMEPVDGNYEKNPPVMIPISQIKSIRFFS